MASNALKVRVGIFVIVGICLVVGILIVLFSLLSTTEKTIYVTYVSESTSGLDKDAAVKYKGVKIGRVAKIRIAPDGQLIEIVMEVNSSFHMKEQFISRVKYAGITGLRYVEIEPRDKDMKLDVDWEVAEKEFHPKYEVVSSAFSDLEQLGDTIQKTVNNINQLDIKKISDKLTTLLDNLDTLVAELKDSNVVTNINKAVAQLNNPKIGETIGHMEATAKKLHTLVSRLEEDGAADKLNALLDNVSMLAGNLNAVTFELQNMTALNGTLMAAQETVRELNQTLREGASTLIFSEPPKPRKISGD
ncbi:MAG: MlaD family protein [Candidatus Brocadiales bacterium]|nr:MlaD family protein [Candidatus Bathyanammoxibius amoris]